MRPSSFTALFFVGCVCCAASESGAPVSAPSVAAPPPPTAGPTQAPPAARDAPVACAKPWNLDVMGGDGRVVVVCAHDVTRQPLEESGPIARALSPGLDPARDRVCACVTRLTPPPFVDLVFTADPEEGRVTVEARGEDDLDPDLGPPFVECVGKIVARFAPARPPACAAPGKVAFIYPVRLDLAP